MVKVTWLGHACFLISNKDKVVTDPYEARCFPGFYLDLDEFKDLLEGVNVVLISHEHADHNYADPFKGARVVRGVEVIGRKLKVDGVEVEVFEVDHGPGRGRCAGFLFKVDDVKFYHFGDTYRYDKEQMEKLKQVGVDVALVPVGGLYTLGPEEAVEALSIMEPKIAIPMHYRIPGKMEIVPHTVNDFLEKAKEKLKCEVRVLGLGGSTEV